MHMLPLHTSASAIKTADLCDRKYVIARKYLSHAPTDDPRLVYVPDVDAPWLERGKRLHTECEAYVKGQGATPRPEWFTADFPEWADVIATEPYFQIGPFHGYIDVITPRRVIDYKFVGTFDHVATLDELEHDPQCVLYSVVAAPLLNGRAVDWTLRKHRSEVRRAIVAVQPDVLHSDTITFSLLYSKQSDPDKYKSLLVTRTWTGTELLEAWEALLHKHARMMRLFANAWHWTDLRPLSVACVKYGGCEYQQICAVAQDVNSDPGWIAWYRFMHQKQQILINPPEGYDAHADASLALLAHRAQAKSKKDVLLAVVDELKSEHGIAVEIPAKAKKAQIANLAAQGVREACIKAGDKIAWAYVSGGDAWPVQDLAPAHELPAVILDALRHPWGLHLIIDSEHLAIMDGMLECLRVHKHPGACVAIWAYLKERCVFPEDGIGDDIVIDGEIWPDWDNQCWTMQGCMLTHLQLHASLKVWCAQ